MKHLISIAALIASAGWIAGCHSELPDERSDGAVRMTSGDGSDQNPCLSPDGATLIFTRFSRGYNDGPAALLSLDLASGREEVLVDDGDHDHVNLPGRCFSPDGRLLTYSSDAEDHDEIWTLDLETGDRTRLTDDADDRAYEPSFSRDGSEIVFERLASGRRGALRVVPTEGGAERVLTSGADDRQPSASPAADEVLFQSDRGGTWGLWTIPIAGGEPAVLFDTDFEETDASYSPDGATVVFATDDCEAISCAATLRDGSVTVRETPEGWYEGAPAITDDGVIYVEASDGDPERGGETAIYRLP